MVCRGNQTGSAKLVDASTITEVLVAHETLNPNWLDCTPKLRAALRTVGYGNFHKAVGTPSKVELHPVVPAK